MLVLLLALCAPAAASEPGDCTACHRVTLEGVHAGISCVSCHGGESQPTAHPSSRQGRGVGCIVCHQGYDAIFDGAMALREAERAFVAQSWGKADPKFFEANCMGCHVSDCLDCHGPAGHALGTPKGMVCLSCHKGYFTGPDYFGLAPREDSLRYQRGTRVEGEPYLKMLPDVHAEVGMECGECHSMKSLLAGERASSGCSDCHTPSKRVAEHRIGDHLERLECIACHAAWGAQEYATYYVRLVNSEENDYFHLRRDSDSPYVKSSYLKKQDRPPLGLDEEGKVAPIRPQFLAYFTDVKDGRPVGEENRLLAARWKPFAPHTVRGGSVMCDGCHGDRRRFLLEKPQERIYLTAEDGLTIGSFWQQEGQEVSEGSFFLEERFDRMNKKEIDFTRGYVEKWKKLVDSVDTSSASR